MEARFKHLLTHLYPGAIAKATYVGESTKAMPSGTHTRIKLLYTGGATIVDNDNHRLMFINDFDNIVLEDSSLIGDRIQMQTEPMGIIVFGCEKQIVWWDMADWAEDPAMVLKIAQHLEFGFKYGARAFAASVGKRWNSKNDCWQDK